MAHQHRPTTPAPRHLIAAAEADEALHERLDRIEERQVAILGRLDRLAGGPIPERRVDRKELAESQSCCVRTVDKWIADGVPHVRLGGPHGSPRFRVSEVEAWLATRSSATTDQAAAE